MPSRMIARLNGPSAATAMKLAKAEFADQADVAQMLVFMEGTKRGVSRSVTKDQEGEE